MKNTLVVTWSHRHYNCMFRYTKHNMRSLLKILILYYKLFYTFYIFLILIKGNRSYIYI